MAPSKLIVVLGATGGQGNSVVEAFLPEKDYTIRGVTRQPQSEKAQALSKKGVEVVKVDIDDQQSLVEAFEGASAIFAMTDFIEPFAKHGPQKAMEIEQKQGENIARAASKTAGWTPALPLEYSPGWQRSDQRQICYPAFRSQEPNQSVHSKLQGSSCENYVPLAWFLCRESLLPDLHSDICEKRTEVHPTVSPDPSTPIWSVGDHRTNTGIFARAIVKNPPKVGGTFVRCFAECYSSLNDYLAVWGRASGLSPSAGSTMVVKVPLDEYCQLWPGWGEEMGSMMDMWSALQERSWSGLDGDHVLNIDEILSADDRKSVITTEAAFRALDWKKIL